MKLLDRWRVPGGSATHVLMDGGVLHVPHSEVQEFYQTCIDLLNSGTKLYVVEQKTELFRFFVDLDYKAQERLADSELLQFCSIIHEALGTTSRCLIARAHPRSIKDGLVKSGVHIHWPDLIVNRIQALNLRTKIILELSRVFDFDWDKVIDVSVYGGSGLRMLWSHKKPTGDPYLPWRELNSEKEFGREPSAELLDLFSVRTVEEPRQAETLVNCADLEAWIQRYLMGQRRARIKKVQRHEFNGWYAQTDSRFCERIKDEHKSNHVWFSIYDGRIHQNCFNEECREFRGTEHILPPSIVEQLNDVAVVGSPVGGFLMDVFPGGPR